MIITLAEKKLIKKEKKEDKIFDVFYTLRYETMIVPGHENRYVYITTNE
jgi:hypothetical protein